MFQAEIDDDYVAGLWKKNIESQLLWEVAEPDERPLPSVPPSWSWASLMGGYLQQTDVEHMITNMASVSH
jgi:hypothetical protein